MKTLKSRVIILMLLLAVLFVSCKRKYVEPDVPVDIMEYYIAGKFTYQNGAELPFALIPNSPTKATFIWVGEKKREVNYTFKDNVLVTSINGASFSCNVSSKGLNNIVVKSGSMAIPVAQLNKKQDEELTFAGKHFEGPARKLNDGAVAYDGYYFRFNTDPSRLNYASNPTSGNFLVSTKAYEKIADGCLYSEQTKTFGVILNNKLEIEMKSGNDFLLISAARK
jgi:hypothetical protein